MAVHLLRLLTEPAAWASSVMLGEAHIIPQWPESTRFALIAVVRNPGLPGQAHTRAFWVTTKEEMDRLLSNHSCRILWFTVAKHQIADDMIDQTVKDDDRLE